jgi:predicted transcriptional regulator of viral defense system
MTLAAQIRDRIKKQAEGKTFGYADLDISKTDYQNAAKVLERLQKNGVIKKISKGVFYKPEQTVFGELQPDYSEQLRPYLFENGKRIAYETGPSLYNRLGLTTQMAFRIKIASQNKRISINRGALKARAVKSYTAVTDTNYELLGLLDAIKDIKRIPDCTVANAVRIVSGTFKKLEDNEIRKVIQYALLYPPRVRGLVGAILEEINKNNNTTKLKESINPLTTFQLGLKEKDLPTIKNWNIE